MESLNIKSKKILFWATFALFTAGLNIESKIAQADYVDYGDKSYESDYTSQDNISEKNADLLTKYMNKAAVISKVGPPIEKIEKAVKQEDVWIYNSFSTIFKKGLLVSLKIKPESDLINKIVLDQSFDQKKPEVLTVKNETKVNRDIEGLLKDFGLAEGSSKKTSLSIN
jgi:hypothetical protein